MSKQNRAILLLKMKAKKASYVESLKSVSNNELADRVYKSGDSFLKSSEWKCLRKSVLLKYGSSCMKCGKANKSGRLSNVDHIKPRKYFPELSLEFSNLQVLCSRCNKEKGNKNSVDYRPLGESIVKRK